MAEIVDETVSVESIRGYVRDMLESFGSDPPDDEFQRGYLEALRVMMKEALGADRLH